MTPVIWVPLHQEAWSGFTSLTYVELDEKFYHRQNPILPATGKWYFREILLQIRRSEIKTKNIVEAFRTLAQSSPGTLGTA